MANKKSDTKNDIKEFLDSLGFNKPSVYDGFKSPEFLKMVNDLFTEVMNEIKDEYSWQVKSVDIIVHDSFSYVNSHAILYGLKLELVSNIAYAPIEIQVMLQGYYDIIKEDAAVSILQGDINEDIKQSIKTCWSIFWHSTAAYDLYVKSRGKELHKSLRFE